MASDANDAMAFWPANMTEPAQIVERAAELYIWLTGRLEVALVAAICAHSMVSYGHCCAPQMKIDASNAASFDIDLASLALVWLTLLSTWLEAIMDHSWQESERTDLEIDFLLATLCRAVQRAADS